MKFETLRNDWIVCLDKWPKRFGLYTNFENRGLCIQLNLFVFGLAVWRTDTRRHLEILRIEEFARNTFLLAQ